VTQWLLRVNDPNVRHTRRLLRAHCERPRDSRAAEQRYERAPFQLIELRRAPAS
jgi:hypothetical protein